MSVDKTLIVVVDTQLFLRAAINQKSLPARLLFEFAEYYILAVSPSIRAEVADVLTRPKVRAKFPALTNERVAQILAILDGGQETIPREILPVSRDPKDDIFLATSAEAQANYLVSEDKDLLVLKEYQKTRIVNALEFLHVLQTIKDTADNPDE